MKTTLKTAKFTLKTAFTWCVSGVSNPDFTNFTKHSTVLTSILQQISILYQHFPSAETAKPALEQAKTMLKIALPTFKSDENHTQNSVCEVRCGENSVRKRQNVCCCGGFMIDCGIFCRGCGGLHVLFRRLQGLFAMKMRCCCGGFMIDCGVFCRGCGGFYVFFRRLQGLFAVKMQCGNGEIAMRKRQKCGAEMAKMWCICGVYMLDFLHFCCQGGEMVVRLLRLVVRFWRFPTMISRISQSIPPFSHPFYSKSASYINIFHLPKPPNPHSNRRKQC